MYVVTQLIASRKFVGACGNLLLLNTFSIQLHDRNHMSLTKLNPPILTLIAAEEQLLIKSSITHSITARIGSNRYKLCCGGHVVNFQLICNSIPSVQKT